MPYTLEHEDHFDNGVLDGDSVENAGVQAESGTSLVQTVNANAEWGFGRNQLAPRFGYGSAGDGVCHRFETRLTGLTIAAGSEILTGLTVGDDVSEHDPTHYSLAYSRFNGSDILFASRRVSTTQTSLGVEGSPTIPTAGSGAHIYRLYWNRTGGPVVMDEDSFSLSDGNIAMYYSFNNGGEFTRLATEANVAIGLINQWGVYGYDNHGAGGGGGTTTFDYLRRYEYTDSAVPDISGDVVIGDGGEETTVPLGSLAFGQQGGVKITFGLTNAIAGPIEVFLGSAGDDTDAPCFGGLGYGYTPITDGSTVTIWTPPTDKGQLKFVAKQEGNLGAPVTANVMERHWPSRQLSMRRSFPPWMGVGARLLDIEDLR